MATAEMMMIIMMMTVSIARCSTAEKRGWLLVVTRARDEGGGGSINFVLNSTMAKSERDQLEVSQFDEKTLQNYFPLFGIFCYFDERAARRKRKGQFILEIFFVSNQQEGWNEWKWYKIVVFELNSHHSISLSSFSRQPSLESHNLQSESGQ